MIFNIKSKNQQIIKAVLMVLVCIILVIGYNKLAGNSLAKAMIKITFIVFCFSNYIQINNKIKKVNDFIFFILMFYLLLEGFAKLGFGF